MKHLFRDYRLFLGEFRRTFRTTGAVLPSGRALARALSKHVRGSGAPLRILEVGPGTGAVTEQIVARMGAQDTLDLVELNSSFVARLHERFSSEPRFQRVASKARLLHQPVETLEAGSRYDVVISGLPLNNFSAEEVQSLLGVLVGLVRSGGTLSFFEYIAVRRLKILVAAGFERQRLVGIERVFSNLFQSHEATRQWILPNVPPAWVHHVRPRPAAAQLV